MVSVSIGNETVVLDADTEVLILRDIEFGPLVEIVIPRLAVAVVIEEVATAQGHSWHDHVLVVLVVLLIAVLVRRNDDQRRLMEWFGVAFKGRHDPFVDRLCGSCR